MQHSFTPIQSRPSSQIAFWDISWKQLGIGLLWYIIAGLVYWLAIFLSSDREYNAWDQTLLNYLLKAILSLPVYYFIFIRCGKWPLQKQLWLHLITMPLYVGVWFHLFRLIANWLKVGYLGGTGAWWDVYIPMLLYIIQFTVIHAYKYYRNTVLQQMRLSELQAAALQNEMSALKAQINPHFLFNTLNSISASVPSAQEKTRELIANLADTFRHALKASQHDWVTLQEEIHFIEQYLMLEKQRFGERLQFNIHYPQTLASYQIPPMLLQPLVENAIKHGVGVSTTVVTIDIRIEEENNQLKVTISDDGPGPFEAPDNSNWGVGLSNTAQRLKKQFGKKLIIEANSPQGVQVYFFIPKKID